MSKQIKYNEDKQEFKVKLSNEEMVLICHLISKVRLGDSNLYSEAAFNFLEKIESADFGFDIWSEVDAVEFSVIVENDCGVLCAKIEGEDAFIDVRES